MTNNVTFYEIVNQSDYGIQIEEIFDLSTFEGDEFLTEEEVKEMNLKPHSRSLQPIESKIKSKLLEYKERAKSKGTASVKIDDPSLLQFFKEANEDYQYCPVSDFLHDCTKSGERIIFNDLSPNRPSKPKKDRVKCCDYIRLVTVYTHLIQTAYEGIFIHIHGDSSKVEVVKMIRDQFCWDDIKEELKGHKRISFVEELYEDPEKADFSKKK